jgi:hypothetical protein
LQIPAQRGLALMSPSATRCRYFLRNTCTYPLMYVSLSSLIFAKKTCAYCAGFCTGFCTGFCAVESRSVRSHHSFIAIALPSHRRIASAPQPSHRHRIGAIGASRRCTNRRWPEDFIRNTFASGAADSLHARSGASAAGSGRSEDEDTCQSHGRKVVTR